ncbi:MAG TPA: glycosyl hydrolase 53 family protein [Verrucomicrobiae bacterium]|nr:glycosyl hydrolase 53 family protein [Verrucomicrobiae bacterium]
MKLKFTLLVTGACLMALVSIAQAQNDFIAGADLSLLPYFETNGIVYKDHGRPGDAIMILKNHGINCVRLRLFTSTPRQARNDPYDYINNLAYTVPLAVRVKEAGLRLMIDFHYSDTWADPGHQATPAEWKMLAFPQLIERLRDYNSNCIAAFSSAGAMPDYVQVGNEITGGMLWPLGRLSGSDPENQWARFTQLMKSAIQGIKDAAGSQMPKIVVHIDRGGDWNTTKWFFDNLNRHDVPYDIIGESYYPFYHGPPANLIACITNTVQRYGRPVIIAETDLPRIYSTNIFNLPASTDGQVQFVSMLGRVMKSAPNNLGAGIFWWGAEYEWPNANEAGVGTRSMFDENGNVLPVADTLGQLATPVNARIGQTSPLQGFNDSRHHPFGP